jgi:hypothetical protein
METETLILTGNKNEDTRLLVEEIKHIDTLINNNNLDKALVCVELIIKNIEDLGLQSEYTYFYDMFKNDYKTLS